MNLLQQILFFVAYSYFVFIAKSGWKLFKFPSDTIVTVISFLAVPFIFAFSALIHSIGIYFFWAVVVSPIFCIRQITIFEGMIFALAIILFLPNKTVGSKS